MEARERRHRQRQAASEALLLIVVLDSGVLGRLCAPAVDRELDTWMTGLLHRGRRVVVPEVCDYELRREMIRNRSKTIALLDDLERDIDYLPITTAAMRRASELWAGLRLDGRPTASDASLDADCVLAAQALVYSEAEQRPVVIATSNVGHLSRMVEARVWGEIA